MGEVSTIGLDIGKSIFQVHTVDEDERLLFASVCAGRRFWDSSLSCRPAWSALRPVRAANIGAASWKLLGTW